MTVNTLSTSTFFQLGLCNSIFGLQEGSLHMQFRFASRPCVLKVCNSSGRS